MNRLTMFDSRWRRTIYLRFLVTAVLANKGHLSPVLEVAQLDVPNVGNEATDDI